MAGGVIRPPPAPPGVSSAPTTCGAVARYSVSSPCSPTPCGSLGLLRPCPAQALPALLRPREGNTPSLARLGSLGGAFMHPRDSGGVPSPRHSRGSAFGTASRLCLGVAADPPTHTRKRHPFPRLSAEYPRTVAEYPPSATFRRTYNRPPTTTASNYRLPTQRQQIAHYCRTIHCRTTIKKPTLRAGLFINACYPCRFQSSSTEYLQPYRHG